MDVLCALGVLAGLFLGTAMIGPWLVRKSSFFDLYEPIYTYKALKDYRIVLFFIFVASLLAFPIALALEQITGLELSKRFIFGFLVGTVPGSFLIIAASAAEPDPKKLEALSPYEASDNSQAKTRFWHGVGRVYFGILMQDLVRVAKRQMEDDADNLRLGRGFWSLPVSEQLPKDKGRSKELERRFFKLYARKKRQLAEKFPGQARTLLNHSEHSFYTHFEALMSLLGRNKLKRELLQFSSPVKRSDGSTWDGEDERQEDWGYNERRKTKGSKKSRRWRRAHEDERLISKLQEKVTRQLDR